MAQNHNGIDHMPPSGEAPNFSEFGDRAEEFRQLFYLAIASVLLATTNYTIANDLRCLPRTTPTESSKAT
jgi:hypothetical protein